MITEITRTAISVWLSKQKDHVRRLMLLMFDWCWQKSYNARSSLSLLYVDVINQSGLELFFSHSTIIILSYTSLRKPTLFIFFHTNTFAFWDVWAIRIILRIVLIIAFTGKCVAATGNGGKRRDKMRWQG